MSQGLPASRLVRVTVNLSPIGAQVLNFDSLLVMGDSNVINVTDRIRSYNQLLDVAADFGITAPEYLAAALFFGQTPQPTQLYIGRWAQAATHGLLIGGTLSAAQKVIGLWTVVTDGAFKIAVDGGGLVSIIGLNFSAQTTLNGVATVINTALGVAVAGATVAWTGSQFVFTSATTGAASKVVPLTAGAGGHTDISAQLLGTASTYSQEVDGIVAETAVAAVAIMDALRTQWYALAFASTHIADADHLAVAAYVEGSSNPHIYGLTTSEAAALTTNDSTSIGFQLKALDYNRTLYQYSSTNPYAVSSLFGRAVTVNFDGNNTVITLMYKQEPGVVAESLTSTQADALDSNNYNYFAAYNNQTTIIVNGKVASGQFVDTIWDVDVLANDIQTNIYNLLYTSPTKIPQTNPGNAQIATQIAAACDQAVLNGTLAPGVWNSAGFGQIVQGSFLSLGYYIYAPPLSTQSEASRAARESVPFQVAAKLAGAIQTVDVQLNINQ